MSVASASNDGSVRVWRLDVDTPPQVFEHDAMAQSVAFSPDGLRVASASIDDTARVWTLDGSAEPIVFEHPAFVEAVAFSPDGRSLVTAAGDDQVRLWSLEGDPGQAREASSKATRWSARSPSRPTAARSSSLGGGRDDRPASLVVERGLPMGERGVRIADRGLPIGERGVLIADREPS